MLIKLHNIEPNILEIAIMEMCRLRNDESFLLDDVVKWIYPQHWFFFISEAEEAMMVLQKSGKIIVMVNEQVDDSDSLIIDSYMIKAKTKTS